MLAIRSGIWFFGVSAWLFGLSDRTLSAIANGYVDAIELGQLTVAAIFFVGWLFLLPLEVDR